MGPSGPDDYRAIVVSGGTRLLPSMSLIGVEFSKDALHPGRVSSVLLWFNEYATPREVIYGYFCACVFRSLLASDPAANAADISSSREAAQKHIRSTHKRMEALT